ncbi:hypothetical protein KUTeg_018721 [Tegillarca granosa]|uniref:Transmembrane protein n=1 Tax=Tegillarca granosa TaxID=220873 RepID=A0ABQ9EES1_TEGGR|nr:hypothetical protein KUTeg_018721 [Tegillarca granosa]
MLSDWPSSLAVDNKTECLYFKNSLVPQKLSKFFFLDGGKDPVIFNLYCGSQFLIGGKDPVIFNLYCGSQFLIGGKDPVIFNLYLDSQFLNGGKRLSQFYLILWQSVLDVGKEPDIINLYSGSQFWMLSVFDVGKDQVNFNLYLDSQFLNGGKRLSQFYLMLLQSVLDVGKDPVNCNLYLDSQFLNGGKRLSQFYLMLLQSVLDLVLDVSKDQVNFNLYSGSQFWMLSVLDVGKDPVNCNLYLDSQSLNGGKRLSQFYLMLLQSVLDVGKVPVNFNLYSGSQFWMLSVLDVGKDHVNFNLYLDSQFLNGGKRLSQFYLILWQSVLDVGKDPVNFNLYSGSQFWMLSVLDVGKDHVNFNLYLDSQFLNGGKRLSQFYLILWQSVLDVGKDPVNFNLYSGSQFWMLSVLDVGKDQVNFNLYLDSQFLNGGKRLSQFYLMLLQSVLDVGKDPVNCNLYLDSHQFLIGGKDPVIFNLYCGSQFLIGGKDPVIFNLYCGSQFLIGGKDPVIFNLYCGSQFLIGGKDLVIFNWHYSRNYSKKIYTNNSTGDAESKTGKAYSKSLEDVTECRFAINGNSIQKLSDKIVKEDNLLINLKLVIQNSGNQLCNRRLILIILRIQKLFMPFSKFNTESLRHSTNYMYKNWDSMVLDVVMPKEVNFGILLRLLIELSIFRFPMVYGIAIVKMKLGNPKNLKTRPCFEQYFILLANHRTSDSLFIGKLIIINLDQPNISFKLKFCSLLAEMKQKLFTKKKTRRNFGEETRFFINGCLIGLCCSVIILCFYINLPNSSPFVLFVLGNLNPILKQLKMKLYIKYEFKYHSSFSIQSFYFLNCNQRKTESEKYMKMNSKLTMWTIYDQPSPFEHFLINGFHWSPCKHFIISDIHVNIFIISGLHVNIFYQWSPCKHFIINGLHRSPCEDFIISGLHLVVILLLSHKFLNVVYVVICSFFLFFVLVVILLLSHKFLNVVYVFFSFCLLYNYFSLLYNFFVCCIIISFVKQFFFVCCITVFVFSIITFVCCIIILVCCIIIFLVFVV